MQNVPPYEGLDNMTYQRYSTRYVQQISFPTGRLLFLKNPVDGMLKSIEIQDVSGTVQRKIEFQYVVKPTNRKLLKEVRFYESNGIYVNKYSFGYMDEEDGIIPEAVHASKDYWGFYSGELIGNNGLMPNWTVSIVDAYGNLTSKSLGNNSRQTDEAKMKTFVLNKIGFPTGGFTEFFYEANRKMPGVGSNYNGSLVGGLRVNSIRSYASEGAVPQVKTYVYGTDPSPESGEGMMDKFPDMEDFRYSERIYVVSGTTISGPYVSDPWESFKRTYYSSEPYTELCPNGSPVIYPVVTEYLGTAAVNTGKTIYRYSTEEALYSTFESNGTTSYLDSPNYLKYLNNYKSWKSGLLLDKSLFQNNQGVYTPVQRESFVYESEPILTRKGMHMSGYVGYEFTDCATLPTTPSFILEKAVYNLSKGYMDWTYNFGWYNIEIERHRIKEHQTFDNGITNTEKYYYENPVHGQITKKKTSTSEGENLVSTYTYPHDYPGQQVYQEMAGGKHIWSAVIEEKRFLEDASSNLEQLSSLRSNYAIWNGNLSNIQLESVETSKSGSAYEPRIRYHSYDSYGNPTCVSKEYGKFITYVWGYGGRYPVAQADNADISQVYSSLGGLPAVQSFCSMLNPTDSQVESFLAPLRSSMLYDRHVDTYTYRHLYGMTTHTDPRNHKMFYEYDGFQRLKAVKDGQGNLMTGYNYQFKP